MSWTWEEIRDDWLTPTSELPDGAEVLGMVEPPEEIVSAFNRVEHLFGRAWIEKSRWLSGSLSRGTYSTFTIVNLGRQLRSLESAAGCGDLIRKLRRRDRSAEGELAAICIARPPDRPVSLECEPSVTVNGRERKADFRLSESSDARNWTYVEVTQPNRAQAVHILRESMRELREVLNVVEGTYAVEVLFLRQPSHE